MAYIVDYALTYGSGGAITNIAMNMPQHQANDVFVVFVTMNSGAASVGATSTPASGSWTISSDATNASHTTSVLRAVATANNNALYLTTADDYCCTIISIRDADTATPVDNISVLGSVTSTSTPSNLGITTLSQDCLILYMMAVDGIATAQHSNPGIHHLYSYDNQGTTAGTAVTQGGGWYFQRSPGLTPAPAWTASAAGVVARATVAIKNKTGGRIPAYIDDSTLPATVISPCHHYSTLNNISFPTSLTTTGSMTNGKTTSYVTGAAQADLGIVPFSSGISKASATQAATALTGYEMALTGGRNMSSGILVGSFIGATPKMGTFGIGSVAEGGCVVRIGSGASNWTAYQVAAKDAVPTLENRSVWAIQPGYANTAYGAGSAVNTSSVTYLQFLTNQPSFSSQTILSEVYLANTQIISGGDSNYPVDTDGVVSVGKSFRLPVIQKFGGYGLLSYVPIQIGGGDAVNFQIDAGALQFPRRYNITTKEISFHAADNFIGISYAGKSGDVIKHTNSVITSPTSYYWQINPSATSDATWDFTGLVLKLLLH